MTSCEDTTCSICLEPLTKDKNITTTACGHIFHAACLLKASRQSSSCPLCRTPLFEEEELQSDTDDDMPELEESPYIEMPGLNNNLAAIFFDLMCNFPDEVVMSEIHGLYERTFSDQQLPNINNMSSELRDNMREELNCRITGYLLFATQEMNAIRNQVELENENENGSVRS